MYQRCQIGWQQPWSPAVALQLLTLYSPYLYYLSLPLKNGKRWPWRIVAEKSSHRKAIIKDQSALTSNFEFRLLERPLSDTLWMPFSLSSFLTSSINRAQRKASQKEWKGRECPRCRELCKFLQIYVLYVYRHRFICAHFCMYTIFK